MDGKLVVIFGIDGSGKSTLIKMLQDRNMQNNIVYINSFSNSAFSNELNSVAEKINISRRECYSQELRSVIWMNDLINNAFNYIIPALERKNNVILDRYSICSRVFLEVMNNNTINYLSKMLECLPTPDLGIYLNVNLNKAMERIVSRKIEQTPYENAEKLYLIKEKYELIIPSEKYKIDIIDANQNIEGVYSDIFLSLSNLLNLSEGSICEK